jgi:iron complex transport system substrate-binding protein
MKIVAAARSIYVGLGLGLWLALGLGLGPAALAAGAAEPAAQTAPATPGAFVLRDDRGVVHRFDAPPRRIVSLLPSLTESIAVLGGADRLVGLDRYSNWPPQLDGLPRLGGLDDAQIEGIAALKPDVVLASTASRVLDRLDALGFKVMRLKSDSHADVRRTVGTLAVLLGTPAEGERLWARVQQQLATAAARVPAQRRGQRVYFEIGGGPYAAGTASFIGETLVALGLTNIVPPELGPFPKLNPEFVVRARPDIVMALQREFAAMPLRPGWAALPGLRADRRCGFDNAGYELVTRPGPRLGEAAALLADCLQGLPR